MEQWRASRLKQELRGANLVVLHVPDPDKAGESGAGLYAFETLLHRIHGAWQLLRDAGVRRFVFAADHGFLLQEGLAVDAQMHGDLRRPKGRHVLSRVAADHAGEVRVPLSALGYEGADGWQLMMPESTALFDRGRRNATFAHGGNSLAERVIPVLTVEHRAPRGRQLVPFAFEVIEGREASEAHVLNARVVVRAQDALSFAATDEVAVLLRLAEPSADTTLELRSAQGGCELRHGIVYARVDEAFTLRFRIEGPTDARVQVELYHPSHDAELQAMVVQQRFGVWRRPKQRDPEGEGERDAASVEPVVEVVSDRAWLQELPDAGARQVFEHLALHGAIDEGEAANMLGGPRQARRFARQFEALAALAPFRVRIDFSAGIKRYVREGGEG